PIAVLLLGQFLLAEGERDRLLRVVLRTVVVAMGVNTALALASIRFDLTAQLSAFWTDEGAASVATKAAEMGRLTGIFNQPAEAGVLYGLAALAAVRLWPDRRLRLALSLVVLTIGGLLTVSKIFLIVAVPLVVVQLLAQRAHRLARLAVVGLATVGVMAALNSPYMSYWLGERFLLRLFDPSDDLVDFYTAGRIGPGSGFGDVIDVTSQTSGLFGVGIRGMTLAYDNAWVEAYVMAGVVGVLGYTAVLLGLAHAVVTGWRRWAPEEAHFAAAVVVLTVVSSIGVPVLSANRAGSAVCLVLALTVLAGTARRSGTPPGVTGTPAVIPPRSAPLNG
ncbi:MAG TPA: hypothetical protein VGD43_23900, partial [Micromonospora sp.]